MTPMTRTATFNYLWYLRFTHCS